MHELPRWITKEMVMEGDEWRRFHETVDSGAGIEAIKLLRIFWTPSMHVSLAGIVQKMMAGQIRIVIASGSTDSGFVLGWVSSTEPLRRMLCGLGREASG